jgi:hypothetical protein
LKQVTVPRPVTQEMNTLSEYQVETLLAAARQTPY